jgi:hypothetical protein
MGERVRVQKLLRSVTSGMLLMWDRGLHSYKMVNATLFQSCHYLGRLPANVKFEVEQVLDDGSYLSWIYPDGKSRKKGGQKIQVRVIEYTIDSDDEPKLPPNYQFDGYCPVSCFIISYRISPTLGN